MTPQQRKALLSEAARFAGHLVQQGRAAEAVDALERLHALDPNNLDIALNLSAAYVLQKKFRKAISVLEQLSTVYADNAMVWTNLGAAYLGNPILASAEMQQKSIDAFKQALAVDPSAPNVAYNIGLVYKDRQENDEAIRWFQRALRTHPGDKDARYWIRRLKETQ